MRSKMLKAAMMAPWEPAKILQKNTIVLGRVISHNVELETKVRVFRMIFDENLHMCFRHFCDVLAHDPSKQCKVGDLILIKKLQKRLSLDVGHEVVKVLYPLGDLTDPITGKKIAGYYYRDQMNTIHEMWGKAPDSGKGFVYEEAPPRGWQEGKKDFTHKDGYNKFHEFEPGHPLYKDPAATIP